MTYYIIIKYIVLLSRCYIQNDPSSTQLWHQIGFVLCYIRPLPGEKSSANRRERIQHHRKHYEFPIFDQNYRFKISV